MQGYSFDRPLIITPTTSFWLSVVVIVSHVFTLLFVVVLLDIMPLYTVPLVLMIALSLAYYYKLHISKRLNKSVLYAVHSFHKGQDHHWLIRLPHKNEDLKVAILPTSFVNNILVILNFKDHNNQKYSLMIPADSVPKHVNRQLRVRLKVMS